MKIDWSAELNQAREIDARDPLAAFRDEFLFPQGGAGGARAGRDLLYFAGNSLGLQPRRARRYIEEELEDWQRFGVEGHLRARHPWLPYHEFLTENLARIVGAKSTEVVAGYECSGNRPGGMEALSSCGRFTGVRLADVLKSVGVGPKAREVVFFGADRGTIDVVFRQQTFKLDQQFGRSVPVADALEPDPILAFNMNGEPLAREHGFPLRLVMPGYYGACNVKWLSEIRVQRERYVGHYQARWYRTIRGIGGTGKDDGPDTQWLENEVTRLQLKSVISRVRKSGSAHTIMGFVLNDGTPLKSVEISIDGGPWQKATLDPANTKYSWKLFSYKWDNATPGEHTIVSRATDIDGQVQPTAADLARKRTFLEDNGQFPRKVKIG